MVEIPIPVVSTFIFCSVISELKNVQRLLEEGKMFSVVEADKDGPSTILYSIMFTLYFVDGDCESRIGETEIPAILQNQDQEKGESDNLQNPRTLVYSSFS